MVLRLNVRGDSSMTRPGGTVSGPALFALSDLAMWALVCTTRGPSPLSVTTNATIDFLRKPEPERDLIAAAEVLKDGKRLVVGRVLITSEEVGSGYSDPQDPQRAVAAASLTYSVPPSSS